MSEKVIDLRSRKEKFESLKESGKEKVNAIVNGVRNNMDVIVVASPVVCAVISGTTKVVSSMIRKHSINKDIDFKQRTIYDHSLGRYVELKKPLTSSQSIIIEERRSNGEKLHTILDSMGLLKK